MASEYTQEQLWKLYENLPEELKEAVFSVETADDIYNTCKRNNVPDEKISKVAKYAGRTLMGLLPPDEFQKTLEKEANLSNETAKTISLEISRFVFYPVKNQLEEIYKIKMAASPKTPKKKIKTETETEKAEAEKPKEKKKETDAYRETIE